MPPVAPPNAPAAASQGAPDAPQQSFRERKAAQLASERETEQPEGRETRRERTPSQPTGSTEDFEQDGQEFEGDDEYDGEQGELFDDPDGGAPDEDDDQDGPEGNHDWQKRYQDLRAEYTQLTQERGEMSQEHANVMAETMRLRFDLEDRFNEATQRAEYMANIMGGNAAQYRNINWSQVPPEKLPELQAQAQQAFQMEQQANMAWQEIKGRADETKSQLKQREAAIAKIRLKRTIPNWGNETYAKLREFAVSQGMDVQSFNDTTNPVVIEALHALMTLRGAGNTIRTNNKRKAKMPRGRNPQQQPRDARGKFERARVVPNQKGSFAAKAAHRLAMERQGR